MSIQILLAWASLRWRKDRHFWSLIPLKQTLGFNCQCHWSNSAATEKKWKWWMSGRQQKIGFSQHHINHWCKGTCPNIGSTPPPHAPKEQWRNKSVFFRQPLQTKSEEIPVGGWQSWVGGVDPKLPNKKPVPQLFRLRPAQPWAWWVFLHFNLSSALRR